MKPFTFTVRTRRLLTMASILAVGGVVEAGPIPRCMTESVQNAIDAGSSPCLIAPLVAPPFIPSFNIAFSDFTFSASGTGTIPDNNAVMLGFDTFINEGTIQISPFSLTSGQSLTVNFGFTESSVLVNGGFSPFDGVASQVTAPASGSLNVCIGGTFSGNTCSTGVVISGTGSSFISIALPSIQLFSVRGTYSISASGGNITGFGILSTSDLRITPEPSTLAATSFGAGLLFLLWQARFGKRRP
jgi:hypothetical protein